MYCYTGRSSFCLGPVLYLLPEDSPHIGRLNKNPRVSNRECRLSVADVDWKIRHTSVPLQLGVCLQLG